MGILTMLGYGLAIIGGLWLLILAFQTSILWGLACFIPFGGLVFVLLHWQESKGAFFTSLAGTLLIIFSR